MSYQDNPDSVGSQVWGSATGGKDSSVWDTLDKWGAKISSPGGKLLTGLAGAGIGAYGAYSQNQRLKDAAAQQQALLAARQAQSQAYSSPVFYNNNRSAVAAPTARHGASNFFTNNGLASNSINPNQTSYFAEGGVVDPYAAPGNFASGGGVPPANEDAPSTLGFIKYMMAGRKFPSEQREEGVAQAMRTGMPNQYMTREQYLQKLQEMSDDTGREPIREARGGYIAGETSGQADKIPAQLSDGEYVFDADSVSSLGDGNNAAGAKRLDQMREAIRAHKRSVPNTKIPPKAKSPLEYLKGRK